MPSRSQGPLDRLLPRITLLLAWVTALDLGGALAGTPHAGLLALLGGLFALHPHRDAVPSFLFVATGVMVLRVTFALPAHPVLESAVAAAGILGLAGLERSAPGTGPTPDGRV